MTRGTCLVCLGVPRGCLVGLDCYSWAAGDSFVGIKGIPDGFHIFRARGSAADEMAFAPWTGEFLFTSSSSSSSSSSSPELLIRKWDPENCEMASLDGSSETDRQLKQRTEYEIKTGEMVVRLVDYQSLPFSVDQDHPDVSTGVSPSHWNQLVDHIDRIALDIFGPLNGRFCSMSAPLSSAEEALLSSLQQARSSTSSSSSPPEEKPKKKEKKATGYCYFTNIPTRLDPKEGKEGRSAQMITDMAFDQSHLLDSLLQHSKGPYGSETRLLLAELQISFVSFWLAEQFEGFQQWKRMVLMLCNCDKALSQRPDLFADFVQVLHHQLESIPEGQFELFFGQESGDHPAPKYSKTDNFVHFGLSSFFELVFGSEDANYLLRQRASSLQSFVQQRFGWSFVSSSHFSLDDYDEDDEYAPAIVSFD